jgi:hypothetical protein
MTHSHLQSMGYSKARGALPPLLLNCMVFSSKTSNASSEKPLIQSKLMRGNPFDQIHELTRTSGLDVILLSEGTPLPRRTLLRRSQPHTMNALNAMRDASNGHADRSQPS